MKKVVTFLIMSFIYLFSFSQEIDSDPFLYDDDYAPSAYSNKLISDEFNDGAIDSKWDIYVNTNLEDDTIFNAWVDEDSGYLLGYDSLVANDFLDRAGLSRKFIGIPFDSIEFCMKPYPDKNFASGQNYYSISLKSGIKYVCKWNQYNNDSTYQFAIQRYYNNVYDSKHSKLVPFNLDGLFSIEKVDFKMKLDNPNSINIMCKVFWWKKINNSLLYNVDSLNIIFTESVNIEDVTRLIFYTCQYNGNGVDGYAATDYVHYYPDNTEMFYRDMIISGIPDTLYSYYDTTFSILIKDSIYGTGIPNAMVILNNNENYADTFYSDSNGIASIKNLYAESSSPININISKSEYFYRDKSYQVTMIDSMKVELETELPVFFSGALLTTLRVIKPVGESFQTIPLPGAGITVTNGISLLDSFVSDSNGEVIVDNYIKSTYKLNVSAIYNNSEYSGTITPYMWSNVGDAFGSNNQCNIVRDSEYNLTYMLYSVGDSFTLAKSYDFGSSWNVEILKYDDDGILATPMITATGENPVLTKIDGGIVAVWNSGGILELSMMHSPWTPADTLGIPTLWYSEASLNRGINNSLVYGSYIQYRDLEDIYGDLIFTSWRDSSDPNISQEIIFPNNGSIEGITPYKSPIMSGYLQETDESYLIGCINSNNQLIAKLYNIRNIRWFNAQTINESGQNCLGPSVDFNGYNSVFVWEVENSQSETEIWQRRLSPYILENSEKVNVHTGANRYPLMRDDYICSYISDQNKLIGYIDGLSVDTLPLTYEVYNSQDSIHSFDANVERHRFDTDVLFAVCEGSNNNYRIHPIKKTYQNEIRPVISTSPTDTAVIDALSSPLRDYSEGKYTVERLTLSIPVLDDNMGYMVKLLTDDKNPQIPQIVMIDGEVMSVIYGGNEPKETEIEVPAYMVADHILSVSIDRKKGNDKRTDEIELYKYEKDGNTVSMSNGEVFYKTSLNVNKITQTDLSVNYSGLKPTLSYILPRSGEMSLKIMDIAGRVVEIVQNNKMSSGKYTYTPKNIANGVYFAVMEYEGQMYRTKIISIR